MSSSIAKRPNGRYRARYRDDAGREHARHFDKKADAQRWLDEVTAAKVTGTYVDPRAGRVTLRAFYADWSARQVWETSTRETMDLDLRACTFADVPLARLRRSHVEAWVKAMTADGRAPRTIRSRLAHVRQVLAAAVADRVIARDPSEGVAAPRLRRAEAAMRLPTAEEVAKLLEASAGRPGHAAIALAAFAGLRRGEIVGLRVSAVDFLRGVVHVERQVQFETGGDGVSVLEERDPKYGSERAVYVPGPLVELLAAHVAEHVPGDDPGRWLFPGGRPGRPVHERTVGEWWDQARTAAKVEGVVLHDLRHFFASGLIAAGCDVVTVQRAMGHSSATTTLSTYAHLWPKAEDRTRAAAASVMAEVERSADNLRTAEGVTGS